MDARIKSATVARRLRGMGGVAYIIDAGTPEEKMIHNARHFVPKGYDLDALCREGRLFVAMNGRNAECRRLMRREIERQAMRTACDLKTEQAKAEASERYPTDAEWDAALARRAVAEVPVTDNMIVENKTFPPFIPFDG